jgi:hypothetical protein
MNSTPGLDGLIEGVIFAIRDDLMPNLDPKSQATAAMAQSILQAVRQMLPVYEACLIDEHNDMTRTLRDAAAQLADVRGAEAGRIRERAATLGQLPDRPTPPLAAPSKPRSPTSTWCSGQAAPTPPPPIRPSTPCAPISPPATCATTSSSPSAPASTAEAEPNHDASDLAFPMLTRYVRHA